MATDPVQRAPVRTQKACGAFTYAVEPGTTRTEKYVCRLPDGHSPSNIHRDGIVMYWDDREMKTSWPSGVPDKCALCGEHDPSHVAVRDGDNLVADRICAHHTLYEVIKSGKFFLQVNVVHE